VGESPSRILGLAGLKDFQRFAGAEGSHEFSLSHRLDCFFALGDVLLRLSNKGNTFYNRVKQDPYLKSQG
jgi:hypothetical protein